MRYEPTTVKGAYVISLEPREDERGFFSRVFCAEEFRKAGLNGNIAQINNSLSASRYTLRGMHYQVSPSGEAKLVRCVAGAAFDVVVDLRPASSTFGLWAGAILTSENRQMMYVPEGCAHGFLTLTDATEMLYSSSAPYDGPRERILRWNDARFGITWPYEPLILSDKDREAGDYDPIYHEPGV